MTLSPSTLGVSSMGAVLDQINHYRALHHARPLQWNSTLTQMAQAHADQLKSSLLHIEHGNLMDPAGNIVGQNIAVAGGPRWDPVKAIKVWYAEEPLYDYYFPSYQKGTGHFTQLVWQSTTDVGVGVARGESVTIVVADFAPAGNVQGQFDKNVHPR